MSFASIDKIVEIRDKRKAAIIAERKLSMIRPGTIKVANQSTTAFTTKVKSPKVKKLMGAVSIRRRGFIMVLITPKTAAATTATLKSATWNPGTKYAVSIRAIELRISFKRRYIFK